MPTQDNTLGATQYGMGAQPYGLPTVAKQDIHRAWASQRHAAIGQGLAAGFCQGTKDGLILATL